MFPATVLIFIFFMSCSQRPEVQAPAGAVVIAKYQVLNEYLSPAHYKCAEPAVEFLQMDPYDCSFRLGRSEFDIEYKILFDTLGRTMSYWRYLPEGPLVYSITDLEKDTVLRNALHINAGHIRISANRQHIIDGKDTFQMEEVFVKEKLLLVRSSDAREKGRCVFFLYQ